MGGERGVARGQLATHVMTKRTQLTLADLVVVGSTIGGCMNQKPSSQPKRRFWQIHLSTAIVTMFVAGGLLWANIRNEVRHFKGGGFVVYVGWPVPLAYDAGLERDDIVWTREEFVAYSLELAKVAPIPEHRSAILKNALVALIAIAFSVVCSETFIRRRKPQP